MNKKSIVIIDILTIVLMFIQAQSMISFINYINHSYYPLKTLLFDSLSLYTLHGWAKVIHDLFGNSVFWIKVFFFFANIYVGLKKAIGIVKKDISPYFAILIFLNVLFVISKLIEAYLNLEMLMGV